MTNLRIILISIICIITFTIKSSAQQQPNWSSFYETGFVWNPALTARWNAWEMGVTSRRSMVGYDDGPTYGNINFQYPFLKRRTKVSVGGYLDYDRVGPYKSIGFTGTYAYKLRPMLFGKKDDVLHLGLKASFRNYRFDPTKLTAFDGLQIDPNLFVEGSSYNPNVGTGIYYQSVSDFYHFRSHYYLGFAVDNLIPTKTHILKYGDITQKLHATVHGGYRYFPGGQSHYYEPSLFMIYGSNNAVNVMLNVRYEELDKYWASLGAVSSKEVFAQVGMIFNDRSILGWLVNDGILRLGFKADFNFGPLSQFGGMGYEVYMAYIFEDEPY